MADITGTIGELARPALSGDQMPSFTLEETYWGYIIRSNDRPHYFMAILQFTATCLGAVLLAGSLGLLMAPQLTSLDSDFSLRLGAAILFAGVAAYLLWFASRGTISELEVDNSQGELREVIRNRAGQSTLLGRYGFDSIGGVFLNRTNGRQVSSLVLRYRNTATILPVANGTIAELEPLRDRLGRDLMLGMVVAERDDRAPKRRYVDNE
jgi:hypothetical protein